MQKSLAACGFANHDGHFKLLGGRSLFVLVVAVTVGMASAFLLAGLPAVWWVTSVEADATCDVWQRDCAVVLPNGAHAELAFAPPPSPANTPLPLRLTITGMTVAQVDAEMAGVSMNMAETKTQLTPEGSGRFGGELMLPICASGPMDWQAHLLVQGSWRSYRLTFRFRSEAR